MVAESEKKRTVIVTTMPQYLECCIHAEDLEHWLTTIEQQLEGSDDNEDLKKVIH